MSLALCEAPGMGRSEKFCPQGAPNLPLLLGLASSQHRPALSEVQHFFISWPWSFCGCKTSAESPGLWAALRFSPPKPTLCPQDLSKTGPWAPGACQPLRGASC